MSIPNEAERVQTAGSVDRRWRETTRRLVVALAVFVCAGGVVDGLPIGEVAGDPRAAVFLAEKGIENTLVPLTEVIGKAACEVVDIVAPLNCGD